MPLGISAVAAEGERQLEEVTVTAERREASIQDTSISITALTADAMEDFGVRNQSDLQNMIPSTTIQIYDSAIRGVGRNFRNLGGDPGVATYVNSVYSEDLYTVTIGSFWDIERVEVLRGPQGTLYGRNAIGGAMNFIYKRPTQEFEADFKAIAGNFDTRDLYGAISGPLIKDTLAARLTFSSREHDGYIEEKGFGSEDLDTGDSENVALQLLWTPTDNFSINLRSTKTNVDRVMGGGSGGGGDTGLVITRGENIIDGTRDFDSIVFGFRPVDATQTNPLASDFVMPGSPILTFNNPATGDQITAQQIRPGVDSPGADGMKNMGRGLTTSESSCVFQDKDDIDGDDICAYTNGLNREEFDPESHQLELSWDINDSVTFKYILGLTDYLYERNIDTDATASTLHDRQFYVNHEADYESHEFQLFYDVGTNLTFTSGLFFYDSTIQQRGDFYTTTNDSQFNDPALDNIIATLRGMGAPLPPESVLPNVPLTFLVGSEPVGLHTAKEIALAEGVTTKGLGDDVVIGPWLGDLGSVEHGPNAPGLGSDTLYDTRTDRESFAFYTQGVWDITPEIALTVGVRYAEDDLEGEENVGLYTETMALLDAFGLDLGTANILRGALDPTTLQPTGAAELWTSGVPISASAYRKLERKDDEVTWRVNLDYHFSPSAMVYGNVTTGYRSGGFNLVFFSETAQYDPEELIAYEVGYKGGLFDNTLQLNASLYYYDYETIHTFGTEPTVVGGESTTTTSVLEAPGAEMKGFELEATWLATDQLTLGGNYSFIDSEYTKSLLIVDGADPRTPASLFANQDDRLRDIKGNQLMQVPEQKGVFWAAYEIPLAENGNVELRGAFSWIDEVYFSQFETEFDKAPAYERLDLRATWTSPARRWIVSAFVNNAFDELGIRQISRSSEEDGFYRTAQTTEPRVYGLELSYRMGAAAY